MREKEKTRFGLLVRLAAPAVLQVALIVAALTWGLVAMSNQVLTINYQVSLLREGRAVAWFLSTAADSAAAVLDEVRRENPHLAGAYLSGDEEILPPPVRGEKVELEGLRAGEELISDGKLYCLTLPVPGPASSAGEARAAGKLFLSYSSEPLRRALDEQTRWGLILGAVAVLLSVGLVFVIVGRLSAPLQELHRGVERLAAGNYAHRIEVRGKGFFGRWASAVNGLAARLEDSGEVLGEKGRLSRDLELARQLQRSYLPGEPPDYRGVDIAGMCEPAFEVGGDYYDFIPIDDRRLGVVVADVAGKSLQGLMVMLMLRTILKSTVPRHTDALPTLCETNTLLSPDMRAGTFVTCCYFVYDSRNQTLDVVNAGHNPLLVFRGLEGRVEELKTRGRPLGLIEPEEFCRTLEDATVELEPGDTVLAYTDGLTESMNDRRELYGERRLKEDFASLVGLAPGALVQRLAATARAFAGPQAQFDDMTLVALQVKRPEVPDDHGMDAAEEVSLVVDRHLTESGR